MAIKSSHAPLLNLLPIRIPMQYNTRLGLILFLIYLLFYCGFVFISAFSPQTMEITPIKGVNLAILYGFGLIVAAFVMAMIYGVMCKSDDGETETSSSSDKNDGGDQS